MGEAHRHDRHPPAGHEHGAAHDPQPDAHGHTHGVLDHDLVTHRRAVRAVWVSAVGLGATALLQLGIVAVTGSVGLFADALHNAGDVAGTASLWLAFSLSRRPSSDEYTYGWRRAEDLAGLFIVAAIAVSAGLAGWEALGALLGGGHEVSNVPLALAAAVVGIAGNEGVAQYKIRVGRAIESVALVADGQHARTDGLASAAAAAGIAGVALGFPLADPLAGMGIALGILWILVRTARDVGRRALDAVAPGVVPAIREAAGGAEGVLDVHDVRARHLGRSLQVQLHIDAEPELPLSAAHEVAESARHAIVHALPTVDRVDVTSTRPASTPTSRPRTTSHATRSRDGRHPLLDRPRSACAPASDTTRRRAVPRLQSLTPESARGKSRELLGELVARHGQVGEMVATMAHSPSVLAGYLDLSRAMKRAKLDRRLSERVSLAVQERLGCPSCLAAHVDAARQLGIDDDEIARARGRLGGRCGRRARRVRPARAHGARDGQRRGGRRAPGPRLPRQGDRRRGWRRRAERSDRLVQPRCRHLTRGAGIRIHERKRDAHREDAG